jgi:enoyl-CoA hydratase/carnithine racemase
MDFRAIKYDKLGHIAALTLNRPGAGNAVDTVMAGEIAEAGALIEADKNVYVVTLTGAGDVFCRGEEDPGAVPRHPAAVIAAIDRPVIAVINGDALGLGLELALAADIRIAAEGVNLGLPAAAGGRIPADGGTQRLPRVVGRGKALELLMTGDAIPANEALEIGLVSRVVPRGELDREARKLAETIAAKGPIALRYLKEAIIKGMDMTLEQGLRLEADLYFLLHTTADRSEGITAFRDKREPDFRGE